MKNEGASGGLIGLVMYLAILMVIVYVIFLLAAVIAAVAAVGGTVYGGGTAIGNYFSSFKENMISSNRYDVS